MLECDGHTHSLRMHGPPMTADQLEVRPFCLLHARTLEASWGLGLGASVEGPMLSYSTDRETEAPGESISGSG